MNRKKAEDWIEGWAFWIVSLIENAYPGATSLSSILRGGTRLPPGPTVLAKDMPMSVAYVDRHYRSLDKIGHHRFVRLVVFYEWLYTNPAPIDHKDIGNRVRTTKEDRIDAWQAHTGMSRSTYYRHRKEFVDMVAGTKVRRIDTH